jgi:hypothetical protein
MSNNILNIQTEWPLPQTDFDRFVLDKYGDYNTLYNGVHHYETEEVENSQGVAIVPAGLQVDSSYSVSFYDYLYRLNKSLREILQLQSQIMNTKKK